MFYVGVLTNLAFLTLVGEYHTQAHAAHLSISRPLQQWAQTVSDPATGDQPSCWLTPAADMLSSCDDHTCTVYPLTSETVDKPGRALP